ncbi:MAG: hypothetical protein E6Q34_00915 [Burkholderiaceae bacterium]|nr:MAG: hypothetical protein E6Q34_00915 [Burkholderiaceae bacterium]
MFGLFKKKTQAPELPKQFPPVPAWRPAISLPIECIVERFRFYTNGTCDFAVFENGTVAILPSNLSDKAAKEHAELALRKVFYAHPDMNPMNMKDGNILIQYKHDVASLVLSDVVEKNWSEIDRQHQQAIATSEVLVTPLGPNVFDDFGKKALFGRCYMFMDAQSPRVAIIERCVSNHSPSR